MKRRLVVASVIILFLIFLVLLYIIFRVGDIRPAIFPPKEDLTESIENYKVGDQVPFPLQIASSFKIGVFAKDLDKARDLEFSPGNTLLVSDPSSGKVVALPDKNKDGRADIVKEIVTGLNKPHGLAFYRSYFYVAELTRISRYKWDEQSLTAMFDRELFAVPYNGGHSTRSLVIDKDGNLFVTIGSSCNVCVEKHDWLAAVVVSDVEGRDPRPFAKGLRNSVFIKIHPVTGELWGTEMGRDLLGDNIPPEEINIIRSGGDYGWPYCFDEKIHDDNFDSKREHSCSKTTSPIWKMQAHSAPLGLAPIDSKQFPSEWQGDLLVSFHGSWNRSVPTGYKIVRLNVEGNKIIGQEDFLTGFLQGSSTLGRPVDLEFDKDGSLYISDDKVGAVYKVSKQ